MPRITVIPPAEAQGSLKEAYDEIQAKRGAIANVHAIHSLHPKTMLAHIDFYVSVLYGRSGLLRRERELMAIAASHVNRCSYCVDHHADAFARYERDDTVVETVRREGEHASLTPRDQALVAYARAVTKAPHEIQDADTDGLQSVGVDDEQILMATLTAAYFNFMNRLVLALDVDLETVRQEYTY